MAGQQCGSSLLPWVAMSNETVKPAAADGNASNATATAAAPPPPLSLVDRCAAPAVFIHQALVFARPLDATKLRAALEESLQLFPTLACRAAQDEVRTVPTAPAACSLPRD